MKELQTATGTVWAVFGHRFAVEGPQGRFLADLGPEGAKDLTLTPGDTVTVTGERKPTEVKVRSLTRGDGTARPIAWPAKPEQPDHAPVDPEAALATAREAGYTPIGEAKRKPKHFEVPASRDGAVFTLHIDLGGALRKAEPIRVA